MTGYNTEALTALRDSINTACQDAAEEIVSAIQDGIITPISTEWYTPEGKDFFTSFADTVNGTATKIQEAFDGFRASVQSAADNWAENTKGATTEGITVELSVIDTPEMSLDVSGISASNGNEIGINETGATKVASNLETVYADIQSRLSEIASGLDASSAFLGGDQASSISTCFADVNAAVAKIFEFLTTGDDSLLSQINKAVEKYGSVASDISSAFTGTEEGK